MVRLQGVHVAMCTPFTSAEAFDEGRFKDHIDFLIDAGVHGIVLNSGTGEFAYMNDTEAMHITEVGVKHIAGRVTVTTQTSTVGLKLCIEKSKAAVDLGTDALMVLPPWLDAPFEAGVVHHYLALADAVDTTFVVYNIPAVSGVEVTPAMWALLSAHPNIGHIKDSTGDLSRMQKLIAVDDGVLGGADPVAPFAAMAGASGWIWGSANVMPHECVALWNHISEGRYAEALKLWREKMLPFNCFAWENGHAAEYITVVKTAASMRFGDLGPSRLPQLPLGDEAHHALTATLTPLG